MLALPPRLLFEWLRVVRSQGSSVPWHKFWREHQLMFLRVNCVSVGRLVVEGVNTVHRLTTVFACDGVAERIEGGLERD